MDNEVAYLLKLSVQLFNMLPLGIDIHYCHQLPNESEHLKNFVTSKT